MVYGTNGVQAVHDINYSVGMLVVLALGDVAASPSAAQLLVTVLVLVKNLRPSAP